MWEFVDPKFKAMDMSWLGEGLRRGTLVWCADGSYNRKTAPSVSGAGWVVECTATGTKMEGSFYEVSKSLSLY